MYAPAVVAWMALAAVARGSVDVCSCRSGVDGTCCSGER